MEFCLDISEVLTNSLENGLADTDMRKRQVLKELKTLEEVMYEEST